MVQSERSDRKTFQVRLDSMIEAIRDDIASGKLKEGEFLPSEKAYAKLYRLGNITVRKGLEALVSEGLIEKVPRVGNRVVHRPANEATVLKFGCHASLLQETAMKTLIGEFHKQNPGIRIEMTTSVTALNKYKYLKPSVDKLDFDVLTMNYNGFDDFRAHDGFEDLETFEPNPRIYPFLTEAMTHNGQLKLQPFVFTPLVLCYNKKHFRDSDVMEPDSSWNWDTLFEAASKLTVENERLGFYFHFPSTNRWPVFLLQSGFRLERDKSGGVSVDRERLAIGLRACWRLIRLQHRFPLELSTEDGDTEELFFNGKVSMIVTTYLSLNHCERPRDFEYDVAPLPYLIEPKSLLMFVGLAINARSAAKGPARKFVDFLVSPEAQMIIRRKTLSIPSLKPIAEWNGEEAVYRPSRFLMYREIIPTLRPFSELNLSMKELELFYREAKLYWSGLETEEAVVERLEEFLASPDERHA